MKMEKTNPSTEESTKVKEGIIDNKPIPKKPVKPPKIEDKPFDEFITEYFIPGLKESIQNKGSEIKVIKLVQGDRPVVGGKCWMIFGDILVDFLKFLGGSPYYPYYPTWNTGNELKIQTD